MFLPFGAILIRAQLASYIYTDNLASQNLRHLKTEEQSDKPGNMKKGEALRGNIEALGPDERDVTSGIRSIMSRS